MADHYPDGLDQVVTDDRWIADVAQEGWVALTKDVSIVRDHQAALRATNLRVFALGNANIAGDEMARRFEANLRRIVQRARKPGPFVDVVQRDRVERRWPAPSPS